MTPYILHSTDVLQPWQKAPLFSAARYMKTTFLRKNYLALYENGANFMTAMYMHIFFARMLVNPLFSHLQGTGFLMTSAYKSQMI